MKIAISTNGRTLSSTVAPFSDCDGDFIIYDSDDLKFTYHNYSSKQGSIPQNGTHFGKVLDDAGVDVLVVGGIAIQAARRLGSYGIRIYECISATVWEAIDGLKLNILQRMDKNSGESITWGIIDD